MTTLNFHSFTERENLLGVAWAYLRDLRPHLTLTTLRDTLEQHPDYPSLLSLGDTLDRYHIENAALRIDAEQLALLQVPYIAHLRTSGGTFVLVERATGEAFTYRTEKGKRITETREDFLKKWSGVVFIAEPTEASGEKDYAAKRQKEQLENLRWPLIIAGFVLLTVAGIFQSPNLSTGVLLGLKAIGMILTALLLSVQYGKTNDFTDSLCRLNNHTDCNHILTSPAAKITSWLGWSEVGFFYFMGGWIFNLTPAPLLSGEGFLNSPSLTGEGAGGWGLGVLSFLALPYTFWSIWYQWRVAKQWCPLCVAVQVVIWVECLSPLTPNGGTILSPHWGLGGLAVAFALPILLWLIIKPLLLKSKQADEWQRELRKFKNNADIFNALLAKQKRMPPVPADLQPIILGNPAAEHTITMVTNPYCGPCGKGHDELEELLSLSSNIKAHIFFTTCHDINDSVGQIARHILALQAAGSDVAAALQGLYKQPIRNYEKWAANFPVSNTEIYQRAADGHCTWTSAANVPGTPTFYVDGLYWGRWYKLNEIGMLLESLEKDLAEST
ncbi:vitamin K epoxide reductase family protein [Runella sp.]|uniref:vitamin K epoxide reductase family protein n=1 Tax=Runella sp. TaxID=1960881 RepID=UPI00262DCEEC|nr:vitamin K epoxide reductase family protein [Runella sp.]